MKNLKKIIVAVFAVMLISSQITSTVAAAGATPGMNGTGIVIDGYYDDWDSVPKTIIEWGNKKGEDVNHEGALLRDDDTLYVYFGLNEKYTSEILRKSSNSLKINGQSYILSVLPITDWGGRGEPDDDKELPNGIHTKYGVFIEDRMAGGLTNVGIDVAYTVYKDGSGKRQAGDCLEFSIDLEKLGKIINVEPDAMKEISIQNTFLGGWVESVGSPTYAALFFLIALPIVMAGFYKYSRKKKGMV